MRLALAFLCMLTAAASAERAPRTMVWRGPPNGARQRITNYTRRDGAKVERTDLFHGRQYLGTALVSSKGGVKRLMHRTPRSGVTVAREWTKGPYRYYYEESAHHANTTAEASIQGPSGLDVRVWRDQQGNFLSGIRGRGNVDPPGLEALVQAARGILEKPPRAEKRLLDTHGY